MKSLLPWKVGPNGTGKFDGDIAFINGGKAYKEVTLTVYERNFDKSGLDEIHKDIGDNSITKREAMVATFTHEGYHDTDHRTIQAVKNRQEGRTDNFDVEAAATNNAEYKVYQDIIDNRKY